VISSSLGKTTNLNYFSRQGFGVTIAGEFSVAPNDCGLFLNGVNSTSANPDCSKYNEWASYNSSMKDGLSSIFQASADALGDWIFWTWKVSPSRHSHTLHPHWIDARVSDQPLPSWKNPSAAVVLPTWSTKRMDPKRSPHGPRQMCFPQRQHQPFPRKFPPMANGNSFIDPSFFEHPISLAASIDHSC
jgi:hypothetical protein